MRHYLHRVSRRLSESFVAGRPYIFLAGAIAIGLLAEGVIRLVEALALGGPQTVAWWLLGIGFAMLLVLVLAFDLWRLLRELFRPATRAKVFTKEPVPRRRGLIVIASLGTYVPAADAMAYHAWAMVPGTTPMLRHCYLIVGPGEGEGSSQANADHLKREYENRGVQVDIWPLQEADNIEDIFEAVKQIYRVAKTRDGLPVQDIIADYTGGTKTMTAGMVLAAAALGGDLQFMKPNKYDARGRADGPAGSRPVQVNANFVAVSDLRELAQG